MEEWYKKILSYKDYPDGSEERKQYDSAMLSQKEFALKYFLHYPEGHPRKKEYERYVLPLRDYLKKYYKNYDISRWKEFLNKFVYPLFDESKRKEYFDLLNKVQAPFFPEIDRLEEFWPKIKDDQRFDDELKHFFAFLFSGNFFKSMSFEEWIKAKNWLHPWHEQVSLEVPTISELLENQYGDNFLKILLVDMGWLKW